ncbi:MAG: class I SAM-dependent rRNA methyltransferase [Alphaproteobacteria bacterium]
MTTQAAGIKENSGSGGDSPASDDPAMRPQITLLPGAQRRAEAGHPWIYSNEIAIDAEAKALPPGALVTLRRADERPFGVALFNSHALIAARLLDRDPGRTIATRFFSRRIERALRIRERLYPAPYYRLVHAEADGLPGLVIDRFGAVLVVQTNAAGMERLLPLVTEALCTMLSPASIVLRNDSPARSQEGLPLYSRVTQGAIDGPVALDENGIRFQADVVGGQKTGWFYDQRDNRDFVAALAGGARVLDLYCYGGGFAVTAAVRGAESVLGIDRSEAALTLAEGSARLNGVAGRCAFRRGDVFAEAALLAGSGERFDIVVVDPPPFARAKRDVPAALRGYRKLARLAAQLTAPGGFLFIASCSYNVGAAEFADSVRRGLADAGRGARILRNSGAGPDHPIHPSLPETGYLKALTLALD